MMRSSLLAVLSAVAASLCCTGPLLLILLGASSLAGFTWLEPFRIYFSLGAVGLVGLAFWRSYRPGMSEAHSSPEGHTRLRRQRRILWLLTPLVGLLLAFPYVHGTVSPGRDDQNAGVQDQGSESTWTIEGMTCPGCAVGLEASLMAEPGMLACDVNYEEGLMRCVTDPARLATDTIPALVDRLGYQARPAVPVEKRASQDQGRTVKGE